jgi:cysteine-rich repeat protein
MDARMLTCVNPCPTGFGSNGTNICDEICGDGKVYEKECDDGNTVDGDGCDSVCKIETGFQCVNGTTTTPSICSSGASPSMKLIETVKDPLKNMVKFLITF